jgi:hypothetical protein
LVCRRRRGKGGRSPNGSGSGKSTDPSSGIRVTGLCTTVGTNGSGVTGVGAVAGALLLLRPPVTLPVTGLAGTTADWEAVGDSGIGGTGVTGG